MAIDILSNSRDRLDNICRGWDPARGFCQMPQVLALSTNAYKTMILCLQLLDSDLCATLGYFKNSQQDLRAGTMLDRMLGVVGAFGHEIYLMHFVDGQSKYFVPRSRFLPEELLHLVKCHRSFITFLACYITLG